MSSPDPSDESDSLSLINNEPDTVDDINYVSAAKTLLLHKETLLRNNPTSAIKINQHLQKYLKELIRKLETLLSESREKYKSNAVLLERRNQLAHRPKVNQRCKSNYFCGKPYFKRLDLFAAPYNADYLYRKTSLKEYFPIDHLDSLHSWNVKDKQLLVNGVKSQLSTFLSSQQRHVARNVNDQLLGGTFSELYQLAENSSFQIDWFHISTKDLHDRHTVNECIRIWNINLKPSLNRQKWSDDDDQKLLEMIDEFNFQNWDKIGLRLNGRSGYECIIHYHKLINDVGDQSICKSKWTNEEDQQLISAVESCRMGTFIPWTAVTEKVSARSKTQVYHRYMHTLKPDLNKTKFTIEEDCILLSSIKEQGSNFTQFSTDLLPGRTSNQIRQRYENVLRHVDSFKEWTYEDDVKLMELTDQMGTTDWRTISKLLIHHTRQSCRTRYTTIRNFLKKYPASKLKDVPRRARMKTTNVRDDNWMDELIKYKTKKSSKVVLPQTRVGLDFHKFFQYSYNFELKLGTSCEANEPASKACRPISYMLKNLLYPKDHKSLYGPTECQMDMAIIADSEFFDSDDYMIPPNLNAALILRGLAIMYSDVDKDCEEVSYDSAALQLFKKRFSTLLYSSAVASQIKFPKTNSKSVTN